ncbi:dienelactone hydrolase family protein [Afipia sp. DC4300-2b1]|uniref:dienelactone hydrolase family protein n=1 Tax=Afipia sp. DC4300-2b1 TaxID=2804672 RepID=UPI003CE7149A
MPRFAIASRFAIACSAIICLTVGLFHLSLTTSGLSITHASVGSTPVTIYRPEKQQTGPAVAIAHGFAGSQQLMQPFAVTLARNGYTAVTFDFLGHGRNPIPMRGDITQGEAITTALMNELAQVTAYAEQLTGVDGRVAVLGHSMASDIVVRFAQAHPHVQATVAVSAFAPVATATTPRNLLVIVGAMEPAMLIDEAMRIVNLAAGGKAVERTTYGRFEDSTARRLALAKGVEHIGVLYSPDSMVEALNWMNAVFGRTQSDYIDQRGFYLGLVFLGLVALAWPLSSLLPITTAIPTGASLGRKPLLIAALAPAVLTPLILWKLPTDFLPILLGDYLALHFAAYGLLTALTLILLRRWLGSANESIGAAISYQGIIIAAAAVAFYEIAGFGIPTNAYVFSFIPIPGRIVLIAAIACGTVPYFMADEWLTRGYAASRGAYPLTKLCFLLSLVIAILLNPQKLFFLAIIAPVILLLFLAFGLISWWSYRRTNHPFAGALANAAFFAWAIAVTFPMIVR